MSAGPLRSQMGSDALQVRGGKLAALAHHVVADLLALVEGAHAGALDRGNMDEHVLSAVGRLDESEALLVVEELHGTFSHLWPPLKTPIGVHGRATIAQPPVRFWRCLESAQWAGGKNRRISNGAHIDEADAFYKRCGCAFSGDEAMLLPMRMALLVNLPLRDYIRVATIPMSRASRARSQAPGSFVTCPISCVGANNERFRLRRRRRAVPQPTKIPHDPRRLHAVPARGGGDPPRGRGAAGTGVPGNHPRSRRGAVRFRRNPPPVRRRRISLGPAACGRRGTSGAARLVIHRCGADCGARNKRNETSP